MMFPCRTMHGRKSGMDKKTIVVLIERPHSAEEPEVFFPVLCANVRIAVDSGLPSMKDPVGVRTPPHEPLLTPCVVITQDKNAVIACIQLHQQLDHLSRLGPSV